ncbi:hypothetical protein KP509_26G037400 [Ceratopteris richardii]|nr:hypothetical protein KP509_26G037400 [Ceratopteris richardii]
MKTYKREEKANGDQNRWSQGHNCVNQGCNKVNTKISLVSKLSSEQYLELTEVLAGEINRQLLEGLDEVSRKIMGDIQVVGVEDLLPVTSDNTLNTQNSMPEEQRFMAKVKLMATVLFPITLRSNQGCATRFPGGSKIRHDSEDIAEGKVRAGELEVSNMPECQQDSEKPSCKPLFKDGHESTAMEPEVNELMETAGKSVNELYLEDDFDTPKDMEVSKQSPLETEKPSAGPRSNCMYEEVDVPESEFYDFECNRSEDNFASGQIWALYDSGKDMMPRDYVEIKRVLGTQPFSVHISLLLPCGLSCGRFNVENRVRESCEINGFSHLMSCRKGPDGSIHIYPSVGEVWALYKNWQLPHPYMFGYDIVQVVFVGKDLTISVIPLANERGSRTVYIKSEAQPFQIDEYALARFSHQIPMYEIIPFDGMEGRLELDPAAIPC